VPTMYTSKVDRTRPYTVTGIGRVKCFRCGNKASQQWQICSDNNYYRPVCISCDIELNKLVLQFMGFENWEEKLDKYNSSLQP
jgi:late competence protein required for DNA uptake (superfamily II DNA/RNA helicase)